MTKEKTFNLDKLVKDAKRRLATHIEKLTAKARDNTALDFEKTRERLGIQ